MNPLATFKYETRYTYAEIADEIARKTGRVYQPAYLGNVARGNSPLSDGLRMNLWMTYGDIFLPSHPQVSGKTHNRMEKAR